MAQPTAESVHVNSFAGGKKRPKRRKENEMDPIEVLENRVFKRDIDSATRKKLAGEGKALGDGSYPIETAEDLKNAAVLARSGHGNVSGAKALIGRRAKALGVKNPLEGSSESTSKADEGESVAIDVRFVKADVEGKVYGIVLEPDLEDSQGDIPSAADIEKACHEHMRDALAPDVQHSGRDAGAVLIENYIAPVDFVLKGSDDQEEKVRKGSWVQAYQIDDPVVKEEVRTGKLTGFSMEGTGIRLPLAV